MKCQPVNNSPRWVTLILMMITSSAFAETPVSRTQLGIYDLKAHTKHIYNFSVSPTPNGATATLTQPDNSNFLLTSHLIPCSFPQPEGFSEGYIKVTQDKVSGIDQNFRPILNFTDANNLLIASKMLSDTRQLLFLEDSLTLLNLDTARLKIDASGCQKN